MSQLPKPREGKFEHFGHVLRHYRETVSDRLRPYIQDWRPYRPPPLTLSGV